MGDLLEKLDKNILLGKTKEELKDLGFSENLIKMLIKNHALYKVENEPIRYILGVEGFALLNQIRMKKAVDRFNNSSWIIVVLTFVIAILTVVLVIR